MMPKEFIEQVLIREIGELHEDHPYIAFAIMAIGIEFLGKCLNEFDDWNESRRSRKDFELAIDELDSFKNYRPLLSSHNLWDSLRNGFAHSFVPKKTLSLSSKDEAMHFSTIYHNKINLKCEDFYNDFRNACEEVINMVAFQNNKMNKSLLEIPSSDDYIAFSGSTS